MPKVVNCFNEEHNKMFEELDDSKKKEFRNEYSHLFGLDGVPHRIPAERGYSRKMYDGKNRFILRQYWYCPLCGYRDEADHHIEEW